MERTPPEEIGRNPTPPRTDGTGTGLEAVVAVSGLSKTYPSVPRLFGWFRSPASRRPGVQALTSIDLDLYPGEVLGLLGPNGAGKTTLIKTLATLVLPTKGSIRVAGFDLGQDPLQVRRNIGYVGSDERSFFWRLSGRENLRFFASLYEIRPREAEERIRFFLDFFSLEGCADQRFGLYSSGRKKLFTIIRGFLPEPPVLVLDEATNSLDPPAAWRLIRYVREELAEKQRRAVLWATHRLEEIPSACHRVMLIDRGQMRFCGTSQEFRELAPRGPEGGEGPRGLQEVFERLLGEAEEAR